MATVQETGKILVRSCWAGLLIWQLVWHAYLPPPRGNQNWALAIAATLPLLILLPGVMKAGHKALTWGMFLVMMYFIIAVMEAWSNADQRTTAVIQLAWTLGFFTGLVLINRPVQPQAE